MQFARGDEGPDRFRYRDRTVGLLAGVDPHNLAGHERVNAVLREDGESKARLELPIRASRAPTSISWSNRTDALYSMSDLNVEIDARPLASAC